MVNAPPNGPPCTVCGYPLRWFGDQNAWGCDRCQRLFPAAPQQQMQHARPKSKLGLWLALGSVAVAGGVVAIVLAMKGGGGGGGAGSAKALAEQTLAAMSAGDVDKLVTLTGIEAMYSTAVKCDDTADPKDKDVNKMLEKAKADYSHRVEKTKGAKLELVDIPDKLEDSPDMTLKKGEKMSKGCVTNMDVRIIQAKIGVKVDGADQKTKMGMIFVDGKWYLLELPDIEKAGGGGGGGQFAPQLAKLGEFRDKLCACKDKACGDAAFSDMQAWSEANMKDLDAAKPSADDMKKASAITEDMVKCMSKLEGGGAPDVNAAEPPAQIATGGGGGGDLPKECDDWKAAIDKLAGCSKYPKQAAESMKKSYEQAAEAWKKLPPDTRASLSTSCATAAKTVADAAKQIGCN